MASSSAPGSAPCRWMACGSPAGPISSTAAPAAAERREERFEGGGQHARRQHLPPHPAHQGLQRLGAAQRGGLRLGLPDLLGHVAGDAAQPGESAGRIGQRRDRDAEAGRLAIGLPQPGPQPARRAMAEEWGRVPDGAATAAPAGRAASRRASRAPDRARGRSAARPHRSRRPGRRRGWRNPASAGGCRAGRRAAPPRGLPKGLPEGAGRSLRGRRPIPCRRTCAGAAEDGVKGQAR